jgi:hypothetical protein
MILFLVNESAPPSRGAAPMDAPFFDRPQPMYSVAVESLSPGKAVAIDANAVSFPLPLDQLDGRYRVQAVFDRDRTGRGHASPGNLASAVSEVSFRRGAADTAELQLSWRIDEEPLPEAPNLRWFEMKSALLSRATGRDVMLRAGIALPAGWDDPNHRRRIFPAVYVVPGFGGRRDAAASMARLLADPATRELVPQAAWVVLDPECPLGHHAFVDSAANGPWGTALVEELKSRDSFAYPMPPTARMHWVSHGDVAQFIVKAFQTPSVSRTSIAVSGPEALTGDEIAERMSKGLGRPIRFRAMPPREFGAVLDRAFGPGTGERVVGFYEAMFEQPALFSSNVDLSAALARLPIAPTTVEAWARARASDLT